VRRNDSRVIAIGRHSNHILGMKAHKGTRSQLSKTFGLAAVLLALVAVSSLPTGAEQLKSSTVSDFERYIKSKESRGNRELADGKNFLWVDAQPQRERSEAYADLKRGQTIVRRSDECADCTSVPGGLIHDWTGIVFIPGITLQQALSTLQDYDNDAKYYQPQVVSSKLLKRSGDDFQVLLRLKQVHVVTVILDTEYDIHYAHLDSAHAYSRSYSTRIAEVENAGEPGEHDLPVGEDHGFLWRLYSYWRFYQADGGVYVQCNAISLTRDIPTGLGWLIRPFIENVPSESLHFTLETTRTALVTKFGNEEGSSQRTGQRQ
jgi:hypothetical protein